MNISLQKVDDLNATLVLNIEKNDYQETVDSEIKKLQKRVVLNGFRQGKAPLSLVNKMYGKAVVIEEVNKLVNQNLTDYITTEKLDLLGQPISSERIESEMDFENLDNFTLAFDLGFAPKFELNINEKTQLDTFIIEIGEKELKDEINYILDRYGKLEPVEIAEENDIIYATLTELDENGNALESGVKKEKVSIVASVIKDETIKNQLIGSTAGKEMQLDIFKLFNDNQSVIASSLGLQAEAVNDLHNNFLVTIDEIQRRIKAEINEELYKSMYGEDNMPADEDEFKQRIKSNLEEYYANEAQVWLDHEISHLLLDAHKIDLPESFLKRWLLATKEATYNENNIDESFEKEKSSLIRRLIIEKIAEANNIEISEDELIFEAKYYFVQMYRQYGMQVSVDDHFVAQSATEKIKTDKNFLDQMHDRALYAAAYKKVRDLISLNSKNVSVEEYFEMVNKHKHQHNEH